MNQDDHINNLRIMLDNSIIKSCDSVISARLDFKTDELKDTILNILRDDFSSDNNFFSHSLTLQENTNIEGLEYYIDRQNIIESINVYVFFDMNHFLYINKTSFPTGNIYIYKLSPKAIISEVDYPQPILNFRVYLSFLAILIESCQKQLNDNELLFHDDKNKEVLIVINKGGELIDSAGVDLLKKVFDSYKTGTANYAKEFGVIISNQICNISNKYKSNDLSVVISNFNNFKLEVIRDYHLFISNFSFEKIKDTFIQDKAKYIEIIDKYVATVQNVIFSIPLSIGLTILLRFIDSNKLLDAIIMVIAFLFYAIVSIIIIIQNRNSVAITERILSSERNKLNKLSSCDDLVENDKEFEFYFGLFDRKISLIKLLSIITVVTMFALSLIFVFRLIAIIPITHEWLKCVAHKIATISWLKPVVEIIRALF